MRLAYKDYVSNFHELLEKDKGVTIHKRNLKPLVIGMYKIHHKTSPIFIRKLVAGEDLAYNTRSIMNVFLDANNPNPKINKLTNFGKESPR